MGEIGLFFCIPDHGVVGLDDVAALEYDAARLALLHQDLLDG